MSVDIFGRHLKSNKTFRGPPGVGFKLTESGDYDIENKRLVNVATGGVDDTITGRHLNETVDVEIKNCLNNTNILMCEIEKIKKNISTNFETIDIPKNESNEEKCG